jgi:hypothetical protein
MNLAIPRQDNPELLLYLWKIIDLPYIPKDDLLFKISYELFLFPPEKTAIFVNKMLKENLLTQDDKGEVSLSPLLNKKLMLWQVNRKKKILKQQKSAEKRRLITTKAENDENFNIFFKILVDKGVLYRAAKITDDAFEIKTLDTQNGSLKSVIKGSKEEPYYIEINLKQQSVKHNCHDFETRRSKNKQFCKHLARLFLLLKEKDEKSAELFLKEIGENIEEWEFGTK